MQNCSWLGERISVASGIKLDASVLGKLAAGESDASLKKGWRF